MRNIITLIAFISSINCYPQVTASLIYNKGENSIELIVKNTSQDDEVTILDNSRGNWGGSKINFYYGTAKDNYLLSLHWWVGLKEDPGLIELKPLDEKRYKYNKAVKYTDKPELKFMKIEYSIDYFISNKPDPSLLRCTGEKVFSIN